MTSHKIQADNLETKILANLEFRERRQMASIRLAACDLRRAVRSLESRSEYLERRREPDPLIRETARREADHCRRIAAAIAEAVRGAL